MYDRKFKEKVVRAAGQPGATQQSVAKEFGITSNSVRSWLKDANRAAKEQPRADRTAEPGTVALDTVLIGLRHENTRLRKLLVDQMLSHTSA